jgi:putative intracellular protease/amidase
VTGASERPTFPPTQRIGIFVYEGFEPIDVFGFAEAFTIARFLGTGYGDPPPYPFAVALIGRRVGKVTAANGPSVLPDWDIQQALSEPPDLLMIPGGGGTWPLLDEKADPAGVAALLDWVRHMDEKG